jgi:hypothetical protein
MHLLTVAAASRVLGLSPKLTQYRIERGDMRVARRNPLRVHLASVVAYSKNMPPVDTRKTGRPRLTAALTSKLARLQEV